MEEMNRCLSPAGVSAPQIQQGNRSMEIIERLVVYIDCKSTDFHSCFLEKFRELKQARENNLLNDVQYLSVYETLVGQLKLNFDHHFSTIPLGRIIQERILIVQQLHECQLISPQTANDVCSALTMKLVQSLSVCSSPATTSSTPIPDSEGISPTTPIAGTPMSIVSTEHPFRGDEADIAPSRRISSGHQILSYHSNTIEEEHLDADSSSNSSSTVGSGNTSRSFSLGGAPQLFLGNNSRFVMTGLLFSRYDPSANASLGAPGELYKALTDRKASVLSSLGQPEVETAEYARQILELMNRHEGSFSSCTPSLPTSASASAAASASTFASTSTSTSTFASTSTSTSSSTSDVRFVDPWNQTLLCTNSIPIRGLHSQNKLCIRMWTVSELIPLFDMVNAAICQEQVHHFSKFIRLLESSCSALMCAEGNRFVFHGGPTYGKVDLRLGIFRSRYQFTLQQQTTAGVLSFSVGDVFNLRSYLLVTSQPLEQQLTRDEGLYIEIENTTALNITRLSAFPLRDSLIIPPSEHFKVVGIVVDPRSRIVILKVRQIGREVSVVAI